MSSDPIAGLAEPARPLRRIHDEILEYRATAEIAKAHLRIWRGPAAEGDRVVVLIGDLTDGHAGITNWIETIATQTQALVGDHPALALWFDYHPGQHAVDHIQFRWSRAGRLLTRRAGWKASSPRWSGVSVSDVERLVGAPVECYPAPAYTATSTERWRRDGGELAIVHDSIDLGGAAAALRHLGETDPGTEWTATAAQACSVLATDVRERLDALQGLEWDDGMRPPRGARSGWPSCFAARLVPPSLTRPRRPARCAVGGHLGRSECELDCMSEESAGCRRVPFMGGQDVDDLPELVHRAVRVDPQVGEG